MRAALAAVFVMLVAPALEARPPHCPPGQARQGLCEPGQVFRLPPGIEAQEWRAWNRHGLRAPGPGRRYVTVGRDLFLIVDATREVVEALGAIDRLLRN